MGLIMALIIMISAVPAIAVTTSAVIQQNIGVLTYLSTSSSNTCEFVSGSGCTIYTADYRYQDKSAQITAGVEVHTDSFTNQQAVDGMMGEFGSQLSSIGKETVEGNNVYTFTRGTYPAQETVVAWHSGKNVVALYVDNSPVTLTDAQLDDVLEDSLLKSYIAKYPSNLVFEDVSPGVQRIDSIDGAKSTYNTKEGIYLTIRGVEGDGSTATSDEGWGVQYYTYKTSDPYTALQEYVPTGNYNGDFDGTYWHADYWAPSQEGSYYTEIVLYCARQGSECWEETGHEYEARQKVYFTVSGTSSASCTDSDSGIDYYNKGTIYGLWAYDSHPSAKEGEKDYCAWVNKENEVSTCEGNSCMLVEFYCTSSTHFGNTPYTCPNGCSYGRCNPAPEPIRCTDSDNGKNYYTKGKVVTSDESMWDYCKSDNVLVELTCDEAGGKAYDYTCPYGCEEGRCLTQGEQEECTDSDGGKDIYTAGSAMSGEGGAGDICITMSLLREAVCQDGKVTQIDVTCPSSAPYCNRGACSTSKPVCTDSDGGIKPEKIGTSTQARMAESIRNTDYCHNSITKQPVEYCKGESWCGLREYYCGAEPTATYYKDVSCPEGCRNGVCLGYEGSTGQGCTDSDGGKNFYKKGTADLAPGEDGGEGTDYCDDSQRLVEYYCGEAGDEPGSAAGMAGTVYTCPYGCRDGKCIEKAECYISNPGSLALTAYQAKDFNVWNYEKAVDAGINYALPEKSLQTVSQALTAGGQESASVIIAAYGSSDGAKMLYDAVSTMHNREVLFDKEDYIGEQTFCHTSPDFQLRNPGLYYYICGFWKDNVYVQVQTTLEENSKDTAVSLLKQAYANIVNECSGLEIEAPEEISEEEELPQVTPITSPDECKGVGCVADHSCLSFGIRLVSNEKPSYCDISGRILSQKNDGSSCQNNYECLSNACSSGRCIDFAERLGSLEQEVQETKGILTRLMSWLKGIFG